MSYPIEGGKGVSSPFHYPGKGAISGHDRPYLAVDVVRWMVNKQSSWRKEKMAVGTIELKIGDHRVEQVLGPFWLRDQAKMAPQFNIPLLADHRYGGDRIHIKATLCARQKDTAFMQIVEGLATWGIEAGGSLAQLAAPATAPLSAVLALAGQAKVANKQLWQTVQQTLRNADSALDPIFDPETGFTYKIEESDIAVSDQYILLHRGTKLNPQWLEIDETAKPAKPILNSKAGTIQGDLEDGAWILLRFRRSPSPSGLRPWNKLVDQWENDIFKVALDVKSGALKPEQGLRKISPDVAGSYNLYEWYRVLREVIFSDFVLAPRDQQQFVLQLEKKLEEAKEIIESLMPNHQGGVFEQSTGAGSWERSGLSQIDSISPLRRWVIKRLLPSTKRLQLPPGTEG